MGLEDKHVRVEASTDQEFACATVRGKHEVLLDESSELPVGGGTDSHPSPVDYMLTSLVACQVSVLGQCMEKARIEDYHIDAEASIDDVGGERIPEEMPPNTASRAQHVTVDLTLTVPEEYESRAGRCVEVYDQGCIVGQSFRAGIEYTPSASVVVADASDEDDR